MTRIAQIKQRLESKTSGKWRVIKKTEKIGCAEYEIAWSEEGELVCDIVYKKDDADLIANAPKDLSDLIAAYEVLESAVNFIQGRNDLMFAECSDAEEIILACREALSRANKILEGK